jgi:hypothetical protein
MEDLKKELASLRLADRARDARTVSSPRRRSNDDADRNVFALGAWNRCPQPPLPQPLGQVVALHRRVGRRREYRRPCRRDSLSVPRRCGPAARLTGRFPGAILDFRTLERSNAMSSFDETSVYRLTRRAFIHGAAGAAALALTRRAHAAGSSGAIDAADLKAIQAEIEKRHDEAVRRIQHGFASRRSRPRTAGSTKAPM